jgi:hemerythrin-like domain-containing protein
MNAFTPIDILVAEHRTIEKVSVAMLATADGIDAGQEPDIAALEQTVEFLRSFADKRHHGKEEDLLFPALARRGVPSTGCPIGGLVLEHQKGRAMVTELADAIAALRNGEPSAKPRISAGLRALGTFYTNHIWKEDQLLFPLAQRLLTPEDNAALQRDFEAVERGVACSQA